MLSKEDFEYIGSLGKTHGVSGEISAKLSVDLSLVYDSEEDLFLMLEETGLLIPYRVVGFRPKNDEVDLIQFSNIQSKEQAEALVHMPVWLSRDYLPEDTTILRGFDSYIGFSLYTADGVYVGKIVSVDETTINTLLLVEREEEEIMLPIADELVVSVDFSASKLQLIIPEGLLSGVMESEED